MASSPLSNYLRRHRKRLGLSQAEVAHLLGAEGGAKVCRYEKFVRTPTLETALAFEVIFGKPVRELFAGLYQKIERKVTLRATAQIRRHSGKAGKHAPRKRQVLTNIAAPSIKKSSNNE